MFPFTLNVNVGSINVLGSLGFVDIPRWVVIQLDRGYGVLMGWTSSVGVGQWFQAEMKQ